MSLNDKFTPNPDDKLEDALALLAAGVPLAEVLAEAGDDAEWLRPLLEIATEVDELQATIPIPAPEPSLQRLLAYGKDLAAASPPVISGSSSWGLLLAQLFGGGLFPRLATGLVTALLVVALLGGAVTVLAQRSLPGQPLYSLKRAGEALRLALTQDPAEHDRLLENYNQRRQLEAHMLLEQGQMAELVFEGRIESLTSTSLTLDGLMVQLRPQTQVNGTLAIGARVQVEALTQPPDQLIALAVTMIEAAPPTPTPIPTSTSTPTPTPSPTATPGLSRATDTLRLPTVTPTHTPSPLPPSPTATPTVIVVEPPTAIPPTGDDNANINENTNDDQGGDDDNANGNEDADNTNDNGDSGGDDNSGSDSGGSSDNSGSGSHSSGSGGGDNSGSGSGGDDNSGSGGSD
jgi:uncharacterized membrane protein YgcG